MPITKGNELYPRKQPEDALAEVTEMDTRIEEREEIVAKKEVAGDVTFFTELDMNDKGRINAAYPAWFDRKRIFNLEEDIKRDERAIDNGWVNAASIGEFRTALSKKKEALARVRDAQERIESKIGKDFVHKTVSSLGEKISAAEPSRWENEKGFTNPHDLAEKWNTPCITLTNEERKLARMANIPMSAGGSVTLVGASMAWQMGRKILGEDANTERLRRER